ncbi:putative sensor (PAS) domain for methyl-accepting chemotaxis sensory transducer [hydrothermal vent metagenome]|uniref:Putative sensor (PAS) domain for methyl-accepting chemotaxis sensory transducer n=1 Tax=hydrothermal vent metagenome TaxID=652676 RepID=A0A3B0US18_9ZZZZ
MARATNLTGVERYFNENELIVSKTNLKGHLTYCNDIFLSIAGYREDECLGKPHSMIRHPDMPRAVFALLWQTLQDGREIFAYVMNRCKNGDHYWVLAHVTPSRDTSGAIIGFHSSRRVPERGILEHHIMPLYKDLLSLERRDKNRKEGLKASLEMLDGFLKEKNMEYDQFIATLAA